jgi:sortase A
VIDGRASGPDSLRRRAVRIASTALITAGLVVLADVGVTLAWGEPISALRAWLAQREAAEELERLETEFDPPGARFDPGRLPSLAERLERRSEAGDAIGRIRIPAIDLSRVLVEGTDTGSLRDGPGHYPDTVLPGQGGTVGVAGHRTTYGAPFRRIDDIEPGDELVLEMPYADFVYRFERSRIVDPSRVGVVRNVAHDRLVLTACHPLYSAAQRYVVFARQVEVRPP